MDDALGVLGISSDVCYVYPRAQTAYLKPSGQVTHSWTGLLGDAPSENEWRTTDFLHNPNASDYLGYLANGHWENYEACCLVTIGGSKTYYMGGLSDAPNTPPSEPTAYDVWALVTAEGTLQRWNGSSDSVAPPPGKASV